MISDEYYVLEKDSENKMFLHSNSEVADFLHSNDYIDPTTILRFKLDEKISSEPIAFDYLKKGISPIFSKRIKEILEVFDYFPAMQFMKSEIIFKDQVFSEDYFYMKVLNCIKCVDKENSDFEISTASGQIETFDELVLLEDELKAKPLQQRLIFRLEESRGVYLYHQSVVDAVMKVDPVGLEFSPVDEWDSYVSVM